MSAAVHRGRLIQTLLFSRKKFTPSQATAWAKKHSFKTTTPDIGKTVIRIRQQDPDYFIDGSWRTMTLTSGVSAVLGVYDPRAHMPNPSLVILSNPHVAKKRGRERPSTVCKMCWYGVAKDGCSQCKRLRSMNQRRHRGNPAPPPPLAWEKFHLRSADHARMSQWPSIQGVPENVTALGMAEGVEMVDQHGVEEEVMLQPTRNDGPMLVTDDQSSTRLWIVAKEPLTDLLPYEGYRSSAVMYFPPATSGKYDRNRGYRHAWGDGSGTPKRDWPRKHFPMLKQVDADGRAFEFVDGNFTVEPAGIVG